MSPYDENGGHPGPPRSRFERAPSVARWVGCIGVALFTLACGPSEDRSDAGETDTGASDSGFMDAALDANLMEGGVADSESRDAGRREPRVPPLRSITATGAEALGSYVRRLNVAAASGGDQPVVWSLINLQCSDRALAINWALALADLAALEGSPPPLRHAEVDAAMRERLLRPSVDSARIFVQAPLVTVQTVVDPEGSSVLEPEAHYWPYHVGAVLNVEGTLSVLDLSLGDRPVPIPEWLAAFTDAEECELWDEDDTGDTWRYWLQAAGGGPGFNPNEPAPNPPCVYHLVPLFQNRWDTEPLTVIELQDLASSLTDQTTVFRGVLSQAGVSVPDSEMAGLLSRYESRSIEWMCREFGAETGYPICVP